METPTKSRRTTTYQGDPPRLQPNGTYIFDSEKLTLVSYMVRVDEDGMSCTCPWWRNHHECKHCDYLAQMRADEKPRVTLVGLFEELGR